jgi:hypothetical protein
MNIAVRCQAAGAAIATPAMDRRCTVAVYFAGLFASVFGLTPELSSALRSPSAY